MSAPVSIPSSVKVVTAPSVEPITVAQAKEHAKIDTDADDTLIQAMITAARMHAEVFTRRRFINTTLEKKYDWFPDEIKVEPLASSTSVTYVRYVAATGNTATMSATTYQVDADSMPSRIRPAVSETWPSIRCGDYNSVTVRYVAGYGSTSTSIPESIKIALREMVAHLYEHREAYSEAFTFKEVPMAANALLWQERVTEGL